MPETHLILAGTHELVVRMALINYRKELQKSVKKDAELGLDTESAEDHLEKTTDLLQQLGWTDPKERSTGEVVRSNEQTGDLFAGPPADPKKHDPDKIDLGETKEDGEDDDDGDDDEESGPKNGDES